MKIVVWPFYSQQDKKTNKFLMRSCGAAKQLSFLVNKLQEQGHTCKAVIPHYTDDKAPFACECVSTVIPYSNPLQRVHWNVTAMERILDGYDLAILNNEYHAIPARAIRPDLKIVQMCSVKPEADTLFLFSAAWNAADLVVAQGDHAARRIKSFTASKVTSWKLAYDEREFNRREDHRDIDVCFVQRCSASNYTYHEEFIAAMRSEWKVVFTDVTNYLKGIHPEFVYSTPQTYIDTLYRSKVVVSLYDSWYGGLSVREAIAAGCTPVMLDATCYRELGGGDWPYYCSSHPDSIRRAIDAALARPLPYRIDVEHESYQIGAQVALRDIATLYHTK